MHSPPAIIALVWGIVYLSSPPSSEAGREDWTADERLVYEQLTQQDCGVLTNLIPAQRLRRRITGGRKSSLMSQPWMAFLHISSDIEMCRCGGALISELFVLTAAHCYKMCPRSREIKVWLGELDISSTSDCTTYNYQRVCAPPVEEFTIEKWILHEEFNLFYPGYDIALIRLNKKVVFKDHIRPICLPLTDELLAFTLQLGKPYMAVGWGKTESSSFANSTMEVYISTEKCTGGRDTSFLCANGDYVDTCTGDSGGPLIWSTLFLGKPRTVQFGVVSTGSQECGAGQKAYYMDVPTFVPWILAKMAEFSDFKPKLLPLDANTV
ncbi:serine protease grass-like [Drosophila teissieri]|uniref:serine protease grass-like n=1 Tax=Drosophila teissieri TaxID=7243 RepID=UPI001CBA05DF|nr:serine protease grass-like [Drosophila teissieri]